MIFGKTSGDDNFFIVSVNSPRLGGGLFKMEAGDTDNLVLCGVTTNVVILITLNLQRQLELSNDGWIDEKSKG